VFLMNSNRKAGWPHSRTLCGLLRLVPSPIAHR
jgi:hypothetical protein